MNDHFRSDWSRGAAARATAALPVITLAVAVLAAGCGSASASRATEGPRTAATPHSAGAPGVSAQPHSAAATPAIGSAQASGAPHVTEAPQTPGRSGLVRAVHPAATQIAHLPLATTYGTTPTAPQDPAPFGSETGTVVHPMATRVIYARPGGPAMAALPVTQLGSPTWLPVIGSQPGWDRVLLPTRPDRSTGWVYLGGGGWQTAYSPYQVDVNLTTYRLTIHDAGRSLGTWTVAEGAPSTPTPTGRTFVLASLIPLQPTYSPLILPLGTHSDTLTTFGGGPGTVGLHGWPDRTVFGHAVSHGCVRVPTAALRALSLVPLGSAVMITG